MGERPSDDLVIRPSWPLPQFGRGRLSYGIPLTMVAGAILIFSLTRWVSIGMPTTEIELSGVLAVVVAAGAAVALAFVYDGVAITANRERIILKRWLQTPVVIPVVDLAAIQQSTQQVTGRNGRKYDQQIVSFIKQDGRCLTSLLWGQFTDEDLDQLSKVTGVRQDGGWFYKHSA